MIKNFNNYFKNYCQNLEIKQRKFVLGLSGGVDSMSLLHLLNNFIQLNKSLKIEIFPVIVDHDLRSNSTNEAIAVQKIALNLGFKTFVKKININKPSGNIQNWARKERRKILCNIAYDLSAILLLGHHSDDQAETIFMRSIKSSGIDGIVGMKERLFWNGISILRPLIFFKKTQITRYAKQNKIIFFQDDSNFMLKYERSKIRMILKNISLTNWPSISDDLIKYSLLNKNLLKKINYVFSQWIRDNVLIDKRGAIRVDFKKLQYVFKTSNLFAINILGKIIKTVGGKEFAPKREKTLRCLNYIFTSSFKNTNLGNVNIFLKNKYLFFIRENRNINYRIEIEKNKKYVFDGRFLLTSKHSGELVNSKETNFNYFKNNCPFIEFMDDINNTIPLIYTLEGRTIKPYLYTTDAASNKKINRKYNAFDLCFINRLTI